MTIIHLENISLKFNGATRYALNQINYEIQHGDFIILLGGNGSGKTSLLKLLYHYHTPNHGHIRLAEKNLNEYSDKELSSKIATLTQNCADSLFTSLTLYENYLLLKDAKHFVIESNKIERKKLQEHLHTYNPNLITKLDCTIDQFSGGERQALALAFCMLQEPVLLLLDEHTSALDPLTSQQIMRLTNQMIVKSNMTCVLTTHDLDIALKYGNRILILRDGEIFKMIDYAAKQQLTKEALIKMYC